MFKHFQKSDLELFSKCSSASIQFARGSLNFFLDCMRVYYQDINYLIVETFTKLFKAELKLYTIHISKAASGGGGSVSNNNNNNNSDVNGGKLTKVNKLNKRDIFNNVSLVEKIYGIIRQVYAEKTGIESNKNFAKLAEKYSKFKEENP